MTNVGSSSIDAMIEDLLGRLPFTRHAIVLSADGLLISHSRALHRDDAEHLAAVASGMQSLARGAGRHFDGGAVRQTVVEMEQTFLVVTAIADGACLAALADADADLGLLAYEMNLMARRTGTHVSPSARFAPPVGARESGPGR